MHDGVYLRSRTVGGDMQRQFHGWFWQVVVDFAVRSNDDKVAGTYCAPHGASRIDEYVAVLQANTEVTVEIDDAEVLQYANALCQIDAGARFFSALLDG